MRNFLSVLAFILLSAPMLSCSPVYAADLDPVAEAKAKAMVEEYLKSIEGSDETTLVEIPNGEPDPAYKDAIQTVGVEETTGNKVYLTDNLCEIHFNEPTPFNRELIWVPKNGATQIGCWYRNQYTDKVYFVVGDVPGIFTWSYDNFKPVLKGEEALRPTEISL